MALADQLERQRKAVQEVADALVAERFAQERFAEARAVLMRKIQQAREQRVSVKRLAEETGMSRSSLFSKLATLRDAAGDEQP